MNPALSIAAAYPRMASYASEIVAVAQRLGADPHALANLINFESGGRTTAINPTSGASGLIQFMPSTAKRLGTTVEAIRKMSAAQQMVYVERYLSPYKGKLSSPAALYMSVFYPVAMAWPTAKEFPKNVQAANPGIKTPADYARLVERRAKLKTFGTVAVAGFTAWWLVGLSIGGYLWWTRSRSSQKALPAPGGTS
jgi:hypothetical protein